MPPICVGIAKSLTTYNSFKRVQRRSFQRAFINILPSCSLSFFSRESILYFFHKSYTYLYLSKKLRIINCDKLWYGLKFCSIFTFTLFGRYGIIDLSVHKLIQGWRNLMSRTQNNKHVRINRFWERWLLSQSFHALARPISPCHCMSRKLLNYSASPRNFMHNILRTFTSR